MNKFIKKAYFVSFYKKMRAEKVVYLFEKHIIANHKIFTKIIFNKNI